MYSVIEAKGFQHKVNLGEKLKIALLEVEAGKEHVFSDVLLVADGDNVAIGQPLVSGASVKAQVIEHGRADKIKVFKKQRRKRFRLTKGHRQDYTLIRITEITHNGKTTVAPAHTPKVAVAESK